MSRDRGIAYQFDQESLLVLLFFYSVSLFEIFLLLHDAMLRMLLSSISFHVLPGLKSNSFMPRHLGLGSPLLRPQIAQYTARFAVNLSPWI